MCLGQQVDFQSRRAFSVLQLIVSIAIVTVLANIVFILYQRSLAAAQQVTCINLKRNMALAANIHHNERGYFPSSIEGTSVWNLALTDYMGVPNTASARSRLYTCGKTDALGRAEYAIHNMWMGFHDTDTRPWIQPYIRINIANIPSPSETTLFTCGYNRQPENSSMRHYFYRSGRASGAASANLMKYNNGSIWAFVDGRVSWISAEEVIQRSGSSGQEAPFIRPFPM